jgi:hypothetical protein
MWNTFGGVARGAFAYVKGVFACAMEVQLLLVV